MEGKNLIVRGEYGRVVDFKEGAGPDIDKYKYLEETGFYKVEATDDYYTCKWGKFWLTFPSN